MLSLAPLCNDCTRDTVLGKTRRNLSAVKAGVEGGVLPRIRARMAGRGGGYGVCAGRGPRKRQTGGNTVGLKPEPEVQTRSMEW